KNMVSTAGTSVNLVNLTPNKTYTVTVQNKCPGTTGNFSTTTTLVTPPLKLQENFSLESPEIYPNPGNGLFTITQTAGWQTVQVLDATGRTLREFNIAGQPDLSLDLTELPEGMYLVQLKNEMHTLVQKLVLKK
ncbi:MAG: T9SS type A sorting domain-containing protein, partial [Chitinophagales bacterium]